MHIHVVLVQALALALATSLDSFVASFAYGSRRIRIPPLSALVIAAVCSGITGLSLALGSVLRQYIPSWLTISVSFLILFVLGVTKLFESGLKRMLARRQSQSRELCFSLFDIKFILTLYASPERADVDGSKTLSPREAASLAVALSLDGITIGLGAALANMNGGAVFLFCLLTNLAAIPLGAAVGNRIVKHVDFDLSWLSGLILILLAIARML